MTTKELNDKVQSMIAKGCKLPVSEIEAIFLKSEANQLKNANRKTKGFDRRAAQEANPSEGYNDGLTQSERERKNLGGKWAKLYYNN